MAKRTSAKKRANRAMMAGLDCHNHYGANGTCTGGPTGFVNMARIKLFFKSMVTGETVDFDAFLTEYTDSFNPEFNQEEVYGRMDPIAIFKNTQRKINIGWSVVGVHHGEMVENWHKMQKYIQMLYPAYKDFGGGGGSLAISAPPLVKVRFMNWAMDVGNDGQDVVYNKFKRSGRLRKEVSFVNSGEDDGLLAVPGSIQVNTNLNDRGAVISGGSPNSGIFEDYAAFPREISVSSEYTILHQHKLGHSFDYDAKDKKGFTVKDYARFLKKNKGAKDKSTQKIVKQATQKLNKLLGKTPYKPREKFDKFPYGMNRQGR